MAVWISAAVISVVGVGALTGLTCAPQENARLVAAVVPPWAEGGMAAVVASGLAVVDMRWQRQVLILDAGGDQAALGGLRAQGFCLMDATGLLPPRTSASWSATVARMWHVARNWSAKPARPWKR